MEFRLRPLGFREFFYKKAIIRLLYLHIRIHYMPPTHTHNNKQL